MPEGTARMSGPQEFAAWRRRLSDAAVVRELAAQTPLVPVTEGVPGGNSLWLKMESQQPVRSFKIRGASYALALRREQLVRRGVVADSGGNHSQALAYAGSRLGVPVKIIMAAVVPETKKRATLGFGARDGSFELDTSPEDFTSAKQAARRDAEVDGRHYLSPYDDEDIIRGAGTLIPEILGQLDQQGVRRPQSLHVPIGGGGLISGLAEANRDAGAPLRIIGHEVEGADSAARSLHAPEPVEITGELNPWAEGLAVRVMGEHPHRRLREGLVEEVLVSTMPSVGRAYRWFRSNVPAGSGFLGEAHDCAEERATGWDEEVWAGLPEVSSMVAVAGVLEWLARTGVRDSAHVVVITGGNTDPQKAQAVLEMGDAAG